MAEKASDYAGALALKHRARVLLFETFDGFGGGPPRRVRDVAPRRYCATDLQYTSTVRRRARPAARTVVVLSCTARTNKLHLFAAIINIKLSHLIRSTLADSQEIFKTCAAVV